MGLCRFSPLKPGSLAGADGRRPELGALAQQDGDVLFAVQVSGHERFGSGLAVDLEAADRTPLPFQGDVQCRAKWGQVIVIPLGCRWTFARMSLVRSTSATP